MIIRGSRDTSCQTWTERPLLGFDLETTGVDPYACRMVDMALVLDRNDGTDPVVWQWLINPGCEIPLECTAIHGISTDYAVEHGGSSDQAVSELQEVISGMGELPPVCVYNAAYDIPIIIRESHGMIGDAWPVLDGMILDKYADTYRPGKRTLTSVSAAYGLGVKNAHRAAGDCVSAIRVTRAIGRKYSGIGRMSLVALQRLQADAYREQMSQFTDYKQKYEDPDFECSIEWPYSAKLFRESELSGSSQPLSALHLG